MTILTAEATLTSRYQNTVPSEVRKALHLKKGDKVRYTITDNGDVQLSRATESNSDPVIGAFLSFLADDMQNNPKNIQAVNPNLVTTINALVDHIEVDLDAPLTDEDE